MYLLDFIPVKVQGDHCVDRVRELRDQEERIDSIDNVLVRCIDSPVSIEDRVADAAMAVDIRVVDGGYEATFRRKHRIVVAHFEVEEESSARIGATRWTLHDDLPHYHVRLAHIDIIMGVAFCS